MVVVSVMRKSYAARQDSVQSGFVTEAVPGSGNQGSTKPLLKQKQKSRGTENQPAMVKNAWTGWDDPKIIQTRKDQGSFLNFSGLHPHLYEDSPL